MEDSFVQRQDQLPPGRSELLQKGRS